MVNSLYQDSNNSSPAIDMNFSGGIISVCTDDLTTAEWKLTACKNHQVINTNNVSSW